LSLEPFIQTLKITCCSTMKNQLRHQR
jgi:hypothetical protein